MPGLDPWKEEKAGERENGKGDDSPEPPYRRRE